MEEGNTLDESMSFIPTGGAVEISFEPQDGETHPETDEQSPSEADTPPGGDSSAPNENKPVQKPEQVAKKPAGTASKPVSKTRTTARPSASKTSAQPTDRKPAPSKPTKPRLTKKTAPSSEKKTGLTKYLYTVLSGNNSALVKRVVRSRPWWEPQEDETSANYHLRWKQSGGGIQYGSLLNRADHRQAVNHLPNNREMCTKTGLVRNLRMMLDRKSSASVALADIVPDTYEFHSYTDNSFLRWKKKFQDNAKRAAAGTAPPGWEKNLWIAKPESLNRGRGISVVRTLEELENVTKLSKATNQQTWIIQKYLEKPMLIDGRKFDIRQYVLVTNTMDVYFYKHGYLRLTSVPYDDASTDPAVHLTNNAVQCKLDHYGEHEEGNMMTYYQLDEAIKAQGGAGLDPVVEQMKAQVKLVIQSVAKKMNAERYKSPFFEVFGFDFMVMAESFKVLTIEVNTNPAISTCSSILKKLLPEMLDDAFSLTLDKSHPPPRGTSKSSIVVAGGSTELEVGDPPLLKWGDECGITRGNRWEKLGSFL
ncbi:Tubulin-tyrosine ligase/Tubulin polyglutamylase [Carpediemonas membranifera]|uniref:Tubulin-tyrosine ligase/Tubulin polyglutamylase n=1 Tax=Carpediemonas membranifera TaxID=201153 RepID=A0A8J6C1B0_9EUKA|nr:Tubulin-tyrosine ligase/Tubulin polyglutamylase [Carpediemonas membranifera]|eukprot:KAG9397386.1 Tubulin-tyrosine ligase/Tubulin polyglutamylase [Carpediemonas membranifera]